MRKIGYIFFLFFITIACSVTKRQKEHIESGSNLHNSEDLLKCIINQNLTTRNFYIEKASFRVRSGDNENSGIATIKFLTPDKFLVSLKTNTGIELARIFLTGDSIFANDRFNKKLYYGSTTYLKNKYGISTTILPVIFGDYVNDLKPEKSELDCKHSSLEIEATVKNLNVRYLLDCIKCKSVSIQPVDILKENYIHIGYSEFLKANDISVPGKIEISDTQHNTTIEIKILKILVPWNGILEFIPGKQYEKIQLL